MPRIIAILLLCLFAFPAQARHHHRHHHHGIYDAGTMVSHPAGCPWRAFCGCGASVEVFGHPVRNLFLARNWFKFPRTNAAPGMVAVRRHHVMVIRSVDANGNATVYDANSGGHRTRVHRRSLAGYTVVNPHLASR
jgi:hypothetical protein